MRKYIFLMMVVGFLVACNDSKTSSEATNQGAASGDSSASKTPPPVEFADAKYMDIGKKNLQLFANGDIDNWVNMYADNAVYLWSAGDSLAGKQAIADYWKNRRKNIIDSMSIKYDIWLPVKINQPQQGPDQKGVWLLNWHQATVKYRSGKKLTFWVHVGLHFNDADKVDRSFHYVDRAPINAAIAGK